MRVVVTGAGSFVGAAFVEELLRQGHLVLATVRPGSESKERLLKKHGGNESFRLFEISLAEIHRLPEMDGGHADVWAHLGWDGAGSRLRTDRELQEKNVGYTLDAVRTAADMGCGTFLFSGSQAELGIRHEVSYEDSLLDPVSAYGHAKKNAMLEAGELCGKLGLKYVHARIFSIYGPGDHPWTLVNTCVDTWRQGGHMKLGACTQQWNFLYIDDAARALCLLTGADAGIYNVAGSDTRPLRAYVEELFSLCGRMGSYEYCARTDNAEGASDLMPDTEKLKSLGFCQQISFADGIKRLMEYKTSRHI